ncbi:MAG: hypothetical protein ACXWP5_08690 [Bdellovibrionota bacterium]
MHQEVLPNPLAPARRFLRRNPWLWKATGWLVGYGVWIQSFRLLVLTLITYILMSSSPKFQDITETFSSNEISLTAISAILFLALARWLNPLSAASRERLFTQERLEKRFLPGFLHGSVLASGVVLAFLVSGVYRFLGFFVQVEEAPLAIVSIAVRFGVIFAFVFCEEYFFRQKILSYLRTKMPDLGAAALLALACAAIKALQFDLGLMQLITLLLVSLALGIRACVENDFARGAGFWCAMLIVFHPLLSLPIFGSEFSGILLIKYQAGTALGAGLDTHSLTTRFVSGGVGGPLSSFAFQLVLLLDIIRSVLRNKKSLLKTSSRQLN